MYFALSEEERELAQAVGTLIDRRAGVVDLRAAIESPAGFDEQLWRTLCDQIGAPALSIPEQLGGAGFSSFQTHVILERLGAALTPGPLLGSGVVATQALLLLDRPDTTREVLSALAEGTSTAAVCWADAESRWRTDGSDVSAAAGPDGVRLTGTTRLVIDGATADLLLVVAADTDGIGLYLISPDGVGVTRTDTPALDPTLCLATVEFRDAPAERLGSLDGKLEDLRLRARTAITALQVGGAEEALRRTVAYLTDRVQFDRPLASFQALKHRCADLLVAVETSRSISWSAAWNLAEQPDGATARQQARVAAAWCADAYRKVAAEMVQMHGGIAITWEHDAHLYFKRAHATSLLFGAAHEFRTDAGREVVRRALTSVA